MYRRTAPVAGLSILGLSFWFLLAFPFANHNESYAWRAWLEQAGLLEVLWVPMKPVMTYRPIGMAAAWLGYRLSGGSIYPIELLNFVLAAAAWCLLLAGVADKRLFAGVALIVQGLFFSGYIYLFHLHGVFYSPLLLQLAFLFRAYRSQWGTRTVLVTSALAALLSLVHPFSLLIQLSFLCGLLLERRESVDRRTWGAAGLAVLVLVLLAKVEAGEGTLTLQRRLTGLVVTYRLLEVNRFVSVGAVLLMVVTVLGSGAGRIRNLLAASGAILAAGCLWVEGPWVCVWILLCLVRMALRGRCAVAALLAATALFPSITATGSPTYGIFALMVCAGAVALEASPLEERLARWGSMPAVVLCTVLLASALVLRAGAPVPFMSVLVAPLLAEKEKTFQLEQVLAWLERSEYAGCGVLLARPAPSPFASEFPLRREHRPPTQQHYLDDYLSSRRQESCPRAGSPKPVVSFGSEARADARVLYTVPGRYAGSATIFLPDPAPPSR